MFQYSSETLVLAFSWSDRVECGSVGHFCLCIINRF